MLYPVRKFVMPKELEKHGNGQIPAHLLSDMKPYGQLYHKAGSAWNAMLKAAKRDGLEFSHVGMYRSLKEQERLFFARYASKPTGRQPEVTRVYKGKRYWLRRGMSPAGTPGTSRHGLGCASDIAAVVNKKVVSVGASQKHIDWLVNNAGRYGWSWEVADPKDPEFEIWHLICFDCDNLPADVVSVSANQATKVRRPTRNERRGRKNKMGGGA